MNYWYVARPNELLIDMDKPERSIDHYRRRLNGAVECSKLVLQKVEMHHSSSGLHFHILITLDHSMNDIERAVWEIILHSDIYRGCANIMRSLYGHGSPDLLITPSKFERSPDATCYCKTKHTAAVMKECPAAFSLRGEWTAYGFFGKPSKSLDIPCYTVTPKSKVS